MKKRHMLLAISSSSSLYKIARNKTRKGVRFLPNIWWTMPPMKPTTFSGSW